VGLSNASHVERGLSVLWIGRRLPVRAKLKVPGPGHAKLERHVPGPPAEFQQRPDRPVGLGGRRREGEEEVPAPPIL